MNTFTTKISDYLYKQEVIDFDEIEVINYGILIFASTIGKFIIYAIIFGLLGMTKELIIFSLGFCTLRVCSGGFHAKTFWGCFFITLITIATVIKVSVWLYELKFEFIPLCFLVISTIVVFIFAPGNVKNRPITEFEYRKFKMLSRMIAVVFLVFVFVSYFVVEPSISIYLFSTAVLTQAFNIISKRRECYEEENVFIN